MNFNINVDDFHWLVYSVDFKMSDFNWLINCVNVYNIKVHLALCVLVMCRCMTTLFQKCSIEITVQ